MKAFLFVTITMATAYAVSVYNVVLDEWSLYKTATRRHFRSSDEEFSRLQVYLESKDLVAKHNERYLRGLENYQLGLNHFADHLPYQHIEENMTTRFMEEIAEMRRSSFGTKIKVPEDVKLPKEMDWNATGAVNSVPNQKSCGSCYAFASAAALEAQIFMKNKTLPHLSVQQIVDCSQDFGNSGCNGGTFSKTFEYLKTTGLASEDAYPYENMASKCRVQGKSVSDKVKMYYYMFDGDEEKLKYAVATYGPVAIGVNAGPRTFQLYKGGIYTDSSCGPTLVHAVLLTGYGEDKDTNNEYWIIKNTWGTDWGEKGYMRLARNRKNLCGIGTLAYVPKLD